VMTRKAVAKIAIKQIRFFMRNVRTRMPFKYGVATLTSVPILHLRLDGELENGAAASGWAADILPPKWFDKDPKKEYENNVADLIAAAQAAAIAFAGAARAPQSVFDTWFDGYHETLAFGDDHGLNHLTAGHGSSLLERALIDAVGAACEQTYAQLLATNALGIDLGRIHPELRGVEPSQVLPAHPLKRIWVRHCVGLADPIRRVDIPAGDVLADGLPQALEDYVEDQGLAYFKVKVSGDLAADLERLRDVASLLAEHRGHYWVSLDGNEQYVEMESFQQLLAKLEASENDDLARFYERIIYLEQPLERSVALNPELEKGIREISARKAMLIDESDGDLDSFKRAVALGYSGVSSKNCKGLIKALANQGLARHYSAQGDAGTRPYFLSGEDLMNLPVVPLHQDLTHAAALGIAHVERNGHHYVRGLDHLSAGEREACSRHHATLYRALDSATLALDVRGGQVDVSSLQRPGLGSGFDVDDDSMTPLENWRFASL
jgi:hypothetical protein